MTNQENMKSSRHVKNGFIGVLDKMEAKKRCKPYVARL